MLTAWHAYGGMAQDTFERDCYHVVVQEAAAVRGHVEAPTAGQSGQPGQAVRGHLGQRAAESQAITGVDLLFPCLGGLH